MTFDEFMDASVLTNCSLRDILTEWADDEFANPEDHIKLIEHNLRKHWDGAPVEQVKHHGRY